MFTTSRQEAEPNDVDRWLEDWMPLHPGRGGKREGAGRKPLPSSQKRNRRIYWLTDDEAEQVASYIGEIRKA